MRKLVVLSLIAVTVMAASTAQAKPQSDYVTRGLLCIHHYEGSWTDPYGPYYGGLQMDLSFQYTYGRAFLRRWGTADQWPVWAQLQAGRNGYRSRGWSPWPNTARMCGLR